MKNVAPGANTSLLEFATQSLIANIEQLPSGAYLTAGRNQFKTLWTRDFALSVRGLLWIGKSDVVRSHLGRLIRERRLTDALVPRVMDSTYVAWRVVRQFVLRVVPLVFRKYIPDPAFRDPLKPEFFDEHGTEAIDSNLLVLLASLQYLEKTQDLAWWKENELALHSIYEFYQSKIDDGLITQAPFSDWQDSVKRSGKTFYTNLLYAVVSDRLVSQVGWDISEFSRKDHRSKMEKMFRDPSSGIFLSLEGHGQVSAEGNLLALDLGFVDPKSPEGRTLYEGLKKHAIWNGPAGFPGQATVPAYPKSWKSFAVRVAKLQNYHEDIYWSWLMALSGKVAILMNDVDEALRIQSNLADISARDGCIAEIYQPTLGLPYWRSRFFDAEKPFSWGAAFVIDLAMSLAAADLKDPLHQGL